MKKAETTKPVIIVLNLDASLDALNKGVILNRFIAPIDAKLVEGESLVVYHSPKQFMADQVLDLMGNL